MKNISSFTEVFSRNYERRPEQRWKVVLGPCTREMLQKIYNYMLEELVLPLEIINPFYLIDKTTNHYN